MKKKTTWYPPVERVTLPQFARHAQKASSVALMQAKPKKFEPLRDEIVAEFAAAQRRGK